MVRPGVTRLSGLDDEQLELVLGVLARRRSVSKVDDRAPDDDELRRLLASAVTVADHKGLRPWRLVTLRGPARAALGEAFAEAAEDEEGAAKLRGKPLRAPLLVTVVFAPVEHPKVPEWEQLATAAGAAHLLEVALYAAGWGTMWRTGAMTDAEPVRRLYGLRADERILGWLYVGGVDPVYVARHGGGPRPAPDSAGFLSALRP